MTDPLPPPAMPPPARRARLGRWAIVGWFAALLALPPVLLAAGVRPGRVENRPLAPAPRPAAGRLLDTALYAEISAWFTDRLPGRDRVIAADAWMDFHLLGESPDAQVLVGGDGWLYFREGVQADCVDEEVIRAAVDEVGLAGRVLAAAGKELVLVVAPNKEAIYPEHLGGHSGETGCADANRAAWRALIPTAGLAGYLDTWGILSEAKATAPGLLYHRLDTHWTSLGSGVVAEAILENLAPGLWEPEAFVLGESEERRGDLSGLIGLPLSEMADYWAVRREAAPATSSEPLGGGVKAVISTVAGIPTTGSRGLVLHDSTGRALVRHLRPYFDSLTTVRFPGNTAFGGGTPWLAPRLQSADVLVLVSVERALLSRLTGDFPAALVGALAEVLPHREILLESSLTGPSFGTRWEEAGGEVVTTGESRGAIVLSDLGAGPPGGVRYLVVDVVAPRRTEVRLTRSASGAPEAEAPSQVVAQGEARVVLPLPGSADPGMPALRLGAGEGLRVKRILVVEIPAGGAG